jgi:amino acid transporter
MRDAAGGSFKRDLGWFSLLAMSLGTVIGSGWLMLPGVVAAQAGPEGILAWVLGGLAMLVVALVFAELGAAWPAAGAVAKYPYLSHGSFVGHVAGWAALVSYAVIPPAEAVAVTRYAADRIPSLVTTGGHLSLPGLSAATGILVLISLLNYAGVRYLAIFQNWVTSLKYIPIVLFLLVVSFVHFDPANFHAYQGFAPHGVSGLMVGTASTLFAYVGFRQALDFGAEARNPGRDLPIAVVATIGLAIVTYTGIAVVFTGAIDWHGLAGKGVIFGDWSSLGHLPAPLLDITKATGIGVLAWLIFLDGMISPNGPNATNVGSVPRVAYTMAEDGTLPAFFMRLHPRFGTPGAGLLACFVVEEIFLLLSGGGYGALISVVDVAFMVGYAFGPVSMGTLRIAAPEAERPFRLRGASVLAPLAFVVSSLLLFCSRWPETGWTLLVIGVGVLIFAAYAWVGRVHFSSVRYGLWVIVYLLAMAGLSWAGDHSFGGHELLPFGWDLAVVAAVSLAIYYWAIREGVACHEAGWAEASQPTSAQRAV